MGNQIYFKIAGQVDLDVLIIFTLVVRRKLFQKSSPLKVLDQWKPNLV
jgi:hypothetical protein